MPAPVPVPAREFEPDKINAVNPTTSLRPFALFVFVIARQWDRLPRRKLAARSGSRIEIAGLPKMENKEKDAMLKGRRGLFPGLGEKARDGCAVLKSG